MLSEAASTLTSLLLETTTPQHKPASPSAEWFAREPTASKTKKCGTHRGRTENEPVQWVTEREIKSKAN